jgi:hypothetical protein
MGQYYKVIFLAEKEENKKDFIRIFIEVNFGNGMKLTEHSYINNNFVNAIEYLLSPEGSFYKSRIVWAGDYADPEIENEQNLYHITHKQPSKEYIPQNRISSEYKYIVNHTKKQYINKSNYKIYHPLPLLTAEGNGRGGGDYHGVNEDKIGLWSRDIISIEKEIPNNYIKFECIFDNDTE